MRKLGWKTSGGLALACGAVALSWACLNHKPPPPPTGTGGGGSCSVDAGDFPAPNCDDTGEMCPAPTGACPTAPCTATSACLAMADNGTNPVQDFRMRKLHVVAPSALASETVQSAVVDNGINLAKQCGEGGFGAFNWLVRVDTTAMKVTTGGAPPAADPFGKGYCFVDELIDCAMVAPQTSPLTKNSDGTLDTAPIPKLNVPIYVNGDVNNVVVLPISHGQLKGVTISKDGNCIGSYNPNGATPSGMGDNTCIDNGGCERWFTAGSLAGYITLDEADNVPVALLAGVSLCVVLTGSAMTTDGGKNCSRDMNGNILAKGDYCSTTNSAGGCGDSFWLAATFAASAVKINDGTGVFQCSGGSAGDGGVDCGAPDGGGDGGGTDSGPGDGGADGASDAGAG
jgi:hypothetical protein